MKGKTEIVIEKKEEIILTRNLKLLENIDFKIIDSIEELEKALNLLYKEYLKRSYIKENPFKLKVSIFNFLPETTTFIGRLNQDVIATVTLIPDSEIGVPMDEIYSNELNQLRKMGRKIAEVSSLASDSTLFGPGISLMLNAKKMFIVFKLFKLLFDYAKEILKIDDLCISIHPKHEITYKFLLFEDLGGLKYYPSVNNNPAIAKRLNLNGIENKAQNSKGLTKMFLTQKTPLEKLQKKFFLSYQDIKYLGLEKTNFLENISSQQLNYLKKIYPQMSIR